MENEGGEQCNVKGHYGCAPPIVSLSDLDRSTQRSWQGCQTVLCIIDTPTSAAAMSTLCWETIGCRSRRKNDATMVNTVFGNYGEDWGA